MINPGFTITGLWIVVMIVTFLVTSLIAVVIGDGVTDFIDFLGNSFSIALVVVIVLLELYLCSIYVKFKINPEAYGYTRIEQEATEVSE